MARAGRSRVAFCRRAAMLAFVACLATMLAAPSLPRATQAADEAPADPANGSAKLAGAGEIAGGTVPDEQVIAFIDKQIRQGWTDAGITPSVAATDGEWCRRVYLDIVGRIPSVDELRAFVSEKSKTKRAALVSRLLESDRYVEEYARNWTTLWTNLLIGRQARDDQRDMVNREGMQQYLRRSFLGNKSYDRMVHELVSATGSNRPGDPDYNGAVNFLLDNQQENGATATAKVARYFLGLQVQCTQCHNHPFYKRKQEEFWGMNAFFRQMRALPQRDGRDVVAVKLIDEDFAGETGANPKEAEIFYELRNGIMAAALPRFVDGSTIDPSGYVDEVVRRGKLGDLIIESDYFGKAIVNRVWAHYLGYGFTKPVDDMAPENSASHPELLAGLSKYFATQGHDLKRLTRWIVLSEAYSLSSKFGAKNKKDDPSIGESPLFSRFYLRQMQAEQLYESLLVATEAHKARGSYEAQEKAKSEWLQQFVIAFGTDEGDEATTFVGTIPQALMMFNGDLVKKATACEPGSFLHNIATGKLKPKAQATHLYEAALARAPTSVELEAANALAAFHKGDAPAALQDIWWALLNSNEFILNH